MTAALSRWRVARTSTTCGVVWTSRGSTPSPSPFAEVGSYAGFGVADGGLQIDLAAFNTVSVDRDRRTALVGGGTRIRDLLTATLAAGLVTPMGACGSVGVAGLALAGGDTAGRGLHGTACDNIVGAQLVTADGETLELGPGRNEDLFWAIRGGGGNFGVVTRLDFRLFPVLTSYNAEFNFGWSDIGGAMRIFGDLVRETPDEVRAFFDVSAETGASAFCGYYGDPVAANTYLEKWRGSRPGCRPPLQIRKEKFGVLRHWRSTVHSLRA